MTNKPLSTDSYKGVRDFYPADMAVQQYIFDTWAKTAESFGFERYDASVLEPADLYKAKGAENAELVHDQTYTFTDRGDREVTLRPEMTPTVARMIAGKQRELAFPVRWYSIPNFFRYERPQKGRLREFWQLNCDIFGSSDFSSDIEIIALAYQTLIDFGAKPEQFEIQVNDRALMNRMYTALGVAESMIVAINRLNDKKDKIDANAYRTALTEITGSELLTEEILMMLENSDEQSDVLAGLAELGITNVIFNKYLARGFDYYTGTVFEIVDVSGENTRSLLGGGRFDNLTTMFGGEAVSAIGFGMGDVTMRDFLETHNLLPTRLGSTITIMIVPTDAEHNLESQKVAKQIRDQGISVVTNISTKKIGKKISDAADRNIPYVIVIGEEEVASKMYTLKNLETGGEQKVAVAGLLKNL